MEEKEVKKIKLVPAVCTQCGAALEVDPSQEAAVCKFCNTLLTMFMSLMSG